ncbi:TlpA family protein disulfide reductase [bacterium]|nr:TlpA family protein disulfide reductase [bacterium]
MRYFILIATLVLLFGCTGEEETRCSKVACKDGYHCNITTDSCDKNCTQDECALNSQICNETTGVCEIDCTKNSCENGFVCDSSTKLCVVDCSSAGCLDGYHCNGETGLCDVNCEATDCSEENTICDPESGVCQEVAEISCVDTGCPNDVHCNQYTGKCVNSCLDKGCNTGMHCNINTQQCKLDCIESVCGENLYCDPIEKECKELLAYPEGPYGTTVGSVVPNLEWTDIDGKKVSLRKLYTLYKASGYPRAILFVASAGWCQPCRMEAPLLEDLYNDNQLYDGRRKTEIIQTILENNSGDASTDIFAKSWRDQYDITFSVISDPTRVLDNYNAEGSIPFNMIVDPETMTIKNLQNGTDETLSGIRGILSILNTKNSPCRNLTCQENASCQIFPYNQDPKTEETVGCYCKQGYTLDSEGNCIPK